MRKYKKLLNNLTLFLGYYDKQYQILRNTYNIKYYTSLENIVHVENIAVFIK